MLKKKVVCLSLVAGLCVSLAGCGSSDLSGKWYSSDGNSTIKFSGKDKVVVDDAQGKYSVPEESVQSLEMTIKGDLQSSLSPNHEGETKHKATDYRFNGFYEVGDGSLIIRSDSGESFYYFTKDALATIKNENSKSNVVEKHENVVQIAERSDGEFVFLDEDMKEAKGVSLDKVNRNYKKAVSFADEEFIKYFKNCVNLYMNEVDFKVNSDCVYNTKDGKLFYGFYVEALKDKVNYNSAYFAVDEDCKNIYVFDSNYNLIIWDGNLDMPYLEQVK